MSHYTGFERGMDGRIVLSDTAGALGPSSRGRYVMHLQDHVNRQLEALTGTADGESLAAVCDAYDAEGVLYDHGCVEEPVRGREALQSYWAQLMEALPNGRLEWSEPVADGRTVVSQLRLTGRHVGGPLHGRAPAGNPVDVQIRSVWRLADDRDTFVEHHLYYDGDRLDGQLARGVT